LSGRITLRDGGTYHFLAQETDQYWCDGSFVTQLAGQMPIFYVNRNSGHRGLHDLGDIGGIPLDQITIPSTGYQMHGVDIIDGHTYVSLAREGEEGNYIVSRMIEVTDDYVTLGYLTFLINKDDTIYAASI
jgi:hypothetical protein